MEGERLFDRRGAQRHPHGEHEGQPGPLLPHGAEVVGVRVLPREVTGAGAEQQRGVPDDATLVIELRVTSTRRADRLAAGRREKSITLRTGPSQEIARSGSSRYRAASRAYSTAEMTLMSSAPFAISRLRLDRMPSTSSASSATTPRSMPPYTG